jgi:hypothetical protein
MFMKRFTFFLFIIVSACKYNDLPINNCDVRDPANDLPWLKDRIHELSQSSLHQYFRVEQVEYNGEICFYVNDCCAICDTTRPVYRCNGNLVSDVDYSKLVLKGVIWQPIDYVCLMN